MSVRFFLIVCLWLMPVVLPAANSGADGTLEKVTLQLRWVHQFQFAGYYAARHQGYYAEHGLDVEIVPAVPGRTPVDVVLAHKADYGVGNSELLHSYLNGQPLVALAAIYQHSPSALLTLKSSGINTPHKLIGKKVMMVSGTDDIDILAMFVNEGIDLEKINIVPSSYDVHDLIDGKTDAFNAYITNEPFYLKEQNLDSYLVKPVNYGIDFYSDILFTTQQEIDENPQRAAAIREATIKGWEYALQHPQEIIDLLLNEYQAQKTRAHLEFEADAVRKLIQPELVPVGNINPGRFERMADLLVRFDFAEPGYSLDAFIYNPDPTVKRAVFVQTVAVFGGLLVLVLVVAFLLWKFNCRFKKEISQRRAAEEELAKIAYHDVLTGLPNRLLFSEHLRRSMAEVRRNGHQLCVAYIDLDGFKAVNDRYGHPVGDEYLTQISFEMRKALREVDSLSRFGGDEFVAVVSDLKQRDEFLPVLERLQEKASITLVIDGHNIACSASIGVTFYPQEEVVGTDMLIRQADIAMYKAKSAGKHRYHFFQAADA